MWSPLHPKSQIRGLLASWSTTLTASLETEVSEPMEVLLHLHGNGLVKPVRNVGLAKNEQDERWFSILDQERQRA